jgi:hypothetical protein
VRFATSTAAYVRWRAPTRPVAGVCLVRQSEAGQRHAGKADAEFLQRRTARDRLSQALCYFVELVVHTFSFILFSLPHLHLRFCFTSYGFSVLISF